MKTPPIPLTPKNYFHPLFAAGLITSSLLHVLAPADAAPINSSIVNQVTATYEDPLNSGEIINTVSNVIQITLAEVAGITVTQTGIADINDLPIGTAVKGGDTVYFRFDLTNIGSDATQFFVPNKAGLTGAATFQKVQYFDPTTSTWKDIPNSGLTSGNIATGKVLKTRVIVTVNNNSSGDLIVSLGNTPTTINLQNIEISNANISTLTTSDRVFTIDNPDGADGEINGTPVNGTREAMDTQTITIGKQPQAFAAITETAGAYVPADRSITYNLSVNVQNITPDRAGPYVPADLVGTTIPGLTDPGILISDAIPVGTKFISATPPNSSLWIPVYQYAANPIGASDRADTATWSTTPPDTNTLATLRRVGFILRNGRIPKGSTVDGFQIKVAVIDPFTTTTVANIVQLFGNSPLNANNSSDNTPNPNLPVVDESGDTNPNDFNADGTPGKTDPTTGKPFVTPGLITSIGKFDITPISVGTILNGPKDNPAAVANSDSNQDFTNKSILNNFQRGDKLDPPVVGFVNTIQNQTGGLVDIKIVPTLRTGETLPDGTFITLRDPKQPNTTFDVVFKVVNGAIVPTNASKPALVLFQVPTNQNPNYITAIDLPPGTDALKGYPIDLTAFVDLNNDNKPDSNEPQNKTVDRVYAGFIDVFKESRVLAADRTVLKPYSANPQTAKVGQFIEYRITFTNVSPLVPNSIGSQALSPTDFTITEDGYAGTNNWGGLTSNDPGSAMTSMGTVTFSASDKTATTTADPNLTIYTSSIGTLAPQTTGTFTFRRQIK